MRKYCCIFCLHKVFPDFHTCAGDLSHIVRPHKLASLIFYQIHIVHYKLTKLTMVPIHIVVDEDCLQKMVENFWGNYLVSHSNHPSHGNNFQTSCSCCCHRQGLPCIQHDHHWLLHHQVHHSLLLHIHKGFLVCNIFYHHNFCLCIFVLQGDQKGDFLGETIADNMIK